MNADIGVSTCLRTGKLRYRRKRQCQRASGWASTARAYFCRHCGGWHWSTRPMAFGGRQDDGAN